MSNMQAIHMPIYIIQVPHLEIVIVFGMVGLFPVLLEGGDNF